MELRPYLIDLFDDLIFPVIAVLLVDIFFKIPFTETVFFLCLTECLYTLFVKYNDFPSFKFYRKFFAFLFAPPIAVGIIFFYFGIVGVPDYGLQGSVLEIAKVYLIYIIYKLVMIPVAVALEFFIPGEGVKLMTRDDD